MNHNDKDRSFNTTIARILTLNKVKAGEYALDSDALANFREEAKDNNLPMETIWRVFFNKHFRSVSRFIADKQQGIVRSSSEPIQGRIDDMIVYLLLLHCILEEQKVKASPVVKESNISQELYDERIRLNYETLAQQTNTPAHLRNS